MGCRNSRPNVCQKCQTHYSPVHRSYSMHKDFPTDTTTNCSFHLVSLTSSTLGSLRFDPLNKSIKDDHSLFEKGGSDEGNKEEFEMGLIEEKTWSQMINEKIPKVVPTTPITTPPGEPESVNVWELMKDLDDIDPLQSPHHVRSFSFHIFPDPYNHQLTPRLKSNYEVTEYKLVQHGKGKLFFTSQA